MKYKIGDKVKVRKDLFKDIEYKMENSDICNIATEEMIELAGKIVTIKSVGCQYRIKECGFGWTDEMFEDFNKKEKKQKQMQKDIKHVIYNPPATIIKWTDGTKTIVKTSPNDKYDPVFGFLMAYFQNYSGMTKTQIGKFTDDIVKEFQAQQDKKNKKKVTNKEDEDMSWDNIY